MHCEKCGSADTEVIKCPKCGQKSRIKCANCGFSACTDKYCEVISIKSKIKVLTYFAIILIVLMVLILPWVVMKAMEEDPGAKDPTRPPLRPTPSASPVAPVPTQAPTPVAAASPLPSPSPSPSPTPTPPPPTAEPSPIAKVPLELRRKAVVDELRKMVKAKVPHVKDGTDPVKGIDFDSFVVSAIKKGGLDLPMDLAGMAATGKKLPSGTAPEAGDLVFFAMKADGKIGFVGVATSATNFACVFPKQTAMEIPLSHEFFKPKLKLVVRVLQ